MLRVAPTAFGRILHVVSSLSGAETCGIGDMSRKFFGGSADSNSLPTSRGLWVNEIELMREMTLHIRLLHSYHEKWVGK